MWMVLKPQEREIGTNLHHQWYTMSIEVLDVVGSSEGNIYRWRASVSV